MPQHSAGPVYRGTSTVSEVPLFLLPNYIYVYECNHDAIFLIYLQEGSIATGLLRTPNAPLYSLSEGSKILFCCWYMG